jgi:hypothetical protein
MVTPSRPSSEDSASRTSQRDGDPHTRGENASGRTNLVWRKVSNASASFSLCRICSCSSFEGLTKRGLEASGIQRAGRGPAGACTRCRCAAVGVAQLGEDLRSGRDCCRRIPGRERRSRSHRVRPWLVKSRSWKRGCGRRADGCPPAGVPGANEWIISASRADVPSSVSGRTRRRAARDGRRRHAERGEDALVGTVLTSGLVWITRRNSPDAAPGDPVIVGGGVGELLGDREARDRLTDAAGTPRGVFARRPRWCPAPSEARDRGDRAVGARGGGVMVVR